jgi:protein-tyrosine phosphatase
VKILVVCTANVCRSAMAEALLRDRLPATFLLRSCGLLATGRDLPDPLAVAAAAELGATVPSRPSRRLRDADLRDADLVLGLATQHVRDVVVQHRTAFARAFTLAELVVRARAVGSPRQGEDLAGWLARLHEGRAAADLTSAHPDLDVDDPTGGDLAGYRATAARLAELADDVAELLQPFAPRPAARPWPAVHLVVDGAGARLAEVAAAAGGSAAPTVTRVDGWRAAVTEATTAAGPGRIVLCITEEPHGVAMLANRAEHVRAVAVVNAGFARRARRVLEANVLCASSHVGPEALLAILAACSGSDGGTPDGSLLPQTGL